jgi:hypothetical protein
LKIQLTRNLKEFKFTQEIRVFVFSPMIAEKGEGENEKIDRISGSWVGLQFQLCPDGH